MNFQCPIMLTRDLNMTRRDIVNNSSLFSAIVDQGELMEIVLTGRQFT
jgi:hypothetical protein